MRSPGEREPPSVNLMLKARDARSSYRARQQYSAYRETGWPWPSLLPAHWTLLRLKDLARSNVETLPETTRTDQEIAYVDISSVTSDGAIRTKELTTFGGAPSRARRIVRAGDVLISTVRTYLRAIAHVKDAEENLIASTGFSVLRSRNGIEPRFLYYLLRSHEFVERVVAYSEGIGYPAIPPSRLDALPAWRPTLREQSAICSYLDHAIAKIDALIAKKERLIASLQEKRSAYIAHVVTRGLDPAAPLQNSGIEWLGAIPAHWRVMRNRFLFVERDERSHPDLPILEVSIHSGVIIREFSSTRIEQRADDTNAYKRALAGDIAFNKMRMWQGAVGVAPVDGLVSPDYTVARPRGEAVAPLYFAALFKTPGYQIEINRRSHGIVDDRNRLYWDGFADIPALVPPPSEQESIVDAIQTMMHVSGRLQERIETAIEHLREYRVALISAAVTGKIDLRSHTA